MGDETIPGQSTFKHPLKVKAKHNSKLLGFHIQGYYLVYMIIDSNTLLSWDKKIAMLSQHYKPMS